MLFQPPPRIQAEVFSSMPAGLRRPGVATLWAAANKPQGVDSFLEGPSFDREGNLYLTDIPHGRIFRIAPAGTWSLVAEYDGWPNGLKIHRDGRIFITDYRLGLLVLDADSGRVTPLLTHRNSEGFKGMNDLVFASNGDLYFTDQGQTGLHDPTGRVFRLTAGGRLECLLDTVPSPNGLVLSPDEKVLYLAVTRDNSVWRCPIMPDGSLSKVHRFFTFHGVSGPDGLAIDEDGSVAVAHAGLGSVFLLSRKGQPLLQIESPHGDTLTNLAYGGPDRRTLYMTNSETGTILAARLPVAGRMMYSHQ
jgi:gluconolactonase